MTLRPIALLCLIALSPAWNAPAGAAEDAAEMLSCLPRANIRRTRIVDAETILFTTRDRKLYVNKLARQCPGLRRDSQVSYSTDQRQFCAGTTFQVLLRVGASSNSQSITIPGSNEHISMPSPAFVPGPVCALGAFSPASDDEVDALVQASEARRSGKRRQRGTASDGAPAGN